MHILFDIGKTKMRLAGYNGGDIFGEPVILDTPESFNGLVELFTKTAKSLASGDKIESAVGGIGAPLDEEKTEILGSRFAGKPLKASIEKNLDTRVYLENDANIIGLAESVYGAGRDFDVVAYITVSTGVGGTRIVRKKMDEISAGFQPGQDIIDFDKSGFGGNKTGTLEELISGADVARRFGKKAYEIPQKEAVWDELASVLACGLNNVAVYWRPDVIVLGGSMIVGDPAISVSKTEEYLKTILEVFHKTPKIKKAELGDIGGLYGAMAYLRQMNK